MPPAQWNGVVKHLLSDRERLGGRLLDFARQKDHAAAVVSNDRLPAELQRVAPKATAAQVETGVPMLVPASDAER